MTPRLELNFPNPIERAADLYDRVPQLELIRETVRSSTRRIAVIMGERVTGKTSLLNVVQAWAATEPQLAVLLLAPVPSRTTFMEEILEGMAAEADTSLYRLGYRDQTGRFTAATVAEFVRVAGELSALVGRTFLVCLDELDSMLMNCPDDQAYQILDFIVYVSNNGTLPIKFVFTLTRATPQIMRTDSTLFLTAARIAHLTPWTRQEADEFVATLVGDRCDIGEEAHDLLFSAGGGHPYLTKAILQSIADAKRPVPPGTVISADDVRAATVAALSTPEVDLTLANIATAHFTPDELAVLRRLSRSPAPAPDDGSEPSDPAVAELIRRQYVRRADQRYELTFGLLGAWLGGKGGVAVPARHAPARHAVARAVPSPHVSSPQVPARPDAAGSGPAALGPLGGPDAAAVPKLIVDEGRRRAFLGTEEIQLTQQEYRFLRCLIRQAGSVVDRRAVAAAVWPDETGFDGGRDGRLHQLVHRLRDELGGSANAARYIQTRRGLGFYVDPEHVERIPGAES